MHGLINETKKLMQGYRLIFFCAAIVIVIAAFFAGKGHTDLSKTDSGTGITITNPEIESQQGYLCRYTIQETNDSSTNQNINIDISFSTNDGSDPDFTWDDKPLYTGSPRIDYLDNAPCPTSQDDTGVSSIYYSATSMSGKFISGGDVAISTNYIQQPTPTAPYTLQRQCGQDARDYMKQFGGVESLLQSSYSPPLKACIAYIQDYDTNDSENGTTIENITNNQLLAGYTPPPPSSSSSFTPIPTCSPNSSPFSSPPNYNCGGSMDKYTQEKEDSGYFIANQDPLKESVTEDEFDKYLQWLGITPENQ